MVFLPSRLVGTPWTRPSARINSELEGHLHTFSVSSSPPTPEGPEVPIGLQVDPTSSCGVASWQRPDRTFGTVLVRLHAGPLENAEALAPCGASEPDGPSVAGLGGVHSDAAHDPSDGAHDSAVRETHLSILLFLGERVLKLHKPLRFDFADFSTLSSRVEDCRREVDLNRRLAPDVYLGVADVTMEGETLDQVVVMRRLPAERSLAHLACSGPEAVWWPR